MTRPLPPLNALRAFEAAARHLSFKSAAKELNVTPAAVSHQVKALEDLLGVPLFHRLTRALRLDEAAEDGDVGLHRRDAGSVRHHCARSRPRTDRVRFGMRSSALANCAAASSVRPRASRNSPYIS